MGLLLGFPFRHTFYLQLPSKNALASSFSPSHRAFCFSNWSFLPSLFSYFKGEKAAGRLYAADTLGGGLGALLGSAFLLPLGGIEATLYILSGVFLITFIPLILRKPEH